jgi:hypothetical protein
LLNGRAAISLPSDREKPEPGFRFGSVDLGSLGPVVSRTIAEESTASFANLLPSSLSSDDILHLSVGIFVRGIPRCLLNQSTAD